MATAFSFTTSTDVAGVIASARSLGAHLAAKLESFSSDERTLTDELCDMLCIWLHQCPPVGPGFSLQLGKTTVKQEKKNGADLRLVVYAPEGQKECLFQAKVLDPVTGKLRCATASGFASLRTQLIKARNDCGDLAFLLVYVPSKYLDGNFYGFPSWEQGFCSSFMPGQASMFGATVIPVNALLDNANAWIDPLNKVPHVGGIFSNGIPFSDVLLELLVCLRGEWLDKEPARSIDDIASGSSRTLSVAIEPVASWGEIREAAREALGRDG